MCQEITEWSGSLRRSRCCSRQDLVLLSVAWMKKKNLPNAKLSWCGGPRDSMHIALSSALWWKRPFFYPVSEARSCRLEWVFWDGILSLIKGKIRSTIICLMMFTVTQTYITSFYLAGYLREGPASTQHQCAYVAHIILEICLVVKAYGEEECGLMASWEETTNSNK